MYSATNSEYDKQFLTLERKMDSITGRTFKPFIHPSEVQSDGKLKPLTQDEEVLKWQSKNMVSQNDILQNLDKKVDKIIEKVDETDEYLKRKLLAKCLTKRKEKSESYKAKKRPSLFYPVYISSPPDQAKYVPTTYMPKSAITTITSTLKTKGKTACLSTSSLDSQDIPEITPLKIQKEEEIPDKGFQAM
ncbi:hypothetical protein KIW84_052134 [Lathyrus oleraceus]|uniref:Uncharacterized protein n=1 Tax=Pisum sativum TaxID=3888 RepID=A0A9D4WP33_PEA|nr:hypothetical protein KIW84_052134 [Pisum sativum]